MSLESFQRELDSMRAEYRSGLPPRLAGIEGLWRDLSCGLLPPARVADLQRELHSLAGSAKTFGAAEVGTAAAAAEAFLEPFCALATLPGPEERAELSRLLHAVRQVADGTLGPS